MGKFVCIHGHFYQPPRENPWLESVELQDSAAPYHDWNERVTSECYGPDSRARVVSSNGKIINLVNNYSLISFNFGPTLLSWMQCAFPDIHNAIIQGDTFSQQTFSGHGSALAQVYNHMILPLSSLRDKRTQVRWGIRDFEHRFGRYPEGMWLPETAADTESLEVLAEHGIKFTILSPYQASKVRPCGADEWTDVDGGKIDPKRPYLFRLPSGKNIVLFFYDGAISRAVAFDGLLQSGEKLADRLLSAFSANPTQDELVHIATDGESYGHHYRYGDMALAWALHRIAGNGGVKLTSYGEYLQTHPPEDEVVIHEKSSWSCVHGVDRWLRDCGCNSGGHPGWNQAWRTPLRQSLDWLRDITVPLFESQAGRILKDPWAARDDYISVLLDRSPESINAFFSRHAHQPMDPAQRAMAIKLLELERHALLMYTSCGWFFDELSGIETVQVIQYAGRVVQLARETFGLDVEAQFLEHLADAKSNIPEHSDGRAIYNKWVKPAMVDWRQATAHYAIGAMFKNNTEEPQTVFVYTFKDQARELLTAGKTRLVIGRTQAQSSITGESASMEYAVLYMGEHNLTAGVREFTGDEAFQSMARELKEAFEEVDFPKVIRYIDRQFGGSCYSLKSLFKDEERRVLHELLTTTRADLESRYRRIADRYIPLMNFLGPTGKSLLPAVETAANFVLRTDLHRQVESPSPDIEQLSRLLEEAKAKGDLFFDDELSYAIKTRMEALMNSVAANPSNVAQIRLLRQLAELVIPLPLQFNLWKVQNIYWEMLHWLAPEYKKKADAGDEEAQGWLAEFGQLGDRLDFAVDGL